MIMISEGTRSLWAGPGIALIAAVSSHLTVIHIPRKLPALVVVGFSCDPEGAVIMTEENKVTIITFGVIAFFFAIGLIGMFLYD